MAFAWARGRQPERAGAAILFLLATGPLMLRPIFPLRYAGLDMGMFLSDAIGLALALALALRAERFWPLWLCSLQLIVVLGHLFGLARLDVPPETYWIMTRGPTYLQCAVLIAGTAMLPGHQPNSPKYRDWRD